MSAYSIAKIVNKVNNNTIDDVIQLATKLITFYTVTKSFNLFWHMIDLNEDWFEHLSTAGNII